MLHNAMEIDGVDNSSNPADAGKFSHLKSFVTAAREFEATHSESALNLMTRYLGVSITLCTCLEFCLHICNFFNLTTIQPLFVNTSIFSRKLKYLGYRQ